MYLDGIHVGVLDEELLDPESLAEMRGLIDGSQGRGFVRVQAHSQLVMTFGRRQDEVAHFGNARATTK